MDGDLPVLAYRTNDDKLLHIRCSKLPKYATVPLEPVFDWLDLCSPDQDHEGDTHANWYSCVECDDGFSEVLDDRGNVRVTP